MNAKASTPEQAAPEQKLYSATLINGQTFFSRNINFEFGEPRVIDEDHYHYLRDHATKSVMQGSQDHGDARRVRQPYFDFKRVRSVVEDDDDDDDDDLPEIELTAAQLRRGRGPVEISENAIDVDNDMSLADLAGKPRKRTVSAEKATISAPGARSRARARTRKT